LLRSDDLTPSSALLAPWTGPHGGLPPFDTLRVEDFAPALRAAMAAQRAEIAAIATDPQPAAFDNTLLALERSGEALNRVRALFNVYGGSMNSGPMRALQSELSPELAAFNDEIVQNEALFRRVEAVYQARESAGLTPEQQRLSKVVYDRFVRQGAALDGARKARLAEINQELASDYTAFSQNVLADEEERMLVLERVEDLAGLPESLRESYARAAAEKGRAGAWAIANTRSAMDPFLVFSTRRDLRERGWRLWTSRGDNPGPHDNKPLITRIMRLRAEKAALLGFETYAHWITAENMAKTPDAAMNLLMRVWPAARARAREEIAEMQAVVDAEGGGFVLAPWDYRHYAEKVRKAKYDLDQDEVKQYLQLDRLREAMFWSAGRLYGLDFAAVDGVAVYHPDVRVYEVRRAGAHVGLLYFDPYAREGKASGAWMNHYRTQEGLNGHTPIVSNNLNYVPGAPGAPVLISWDDATTLFHEFGHGLHGLLSNVTYRTLAGTSVARDFVEFPSQINEHWLPTPEVLGRFALHHATGEPIPAELVEKIERARTFGQGFKTAEYLGSAIYDLKLHLAAHGQAIDPAAFERDVLAEIGMPEQIVMRHRPPHFNHVFSGDSYSAGYFNYLWADTLTADAFEAFTEAGGAYDAQVARRLVDSVLSVGNTVAPDEAFRSFRGRDVDTAALMRDRGFPVGAEA
jgi:peptidyl-dipeptidase Dcp